MKRACKIIIFIIAILILCIPFLLCACVYLNRIHLVRGSDYIEVDNLICQINDIELNDNTLYIEGYIIYPGIAESYTRENKYLFLKNVESDDMHEARVGEIVIGDDMTNYINDGNSYYVGGFAGKFDLSVLDLKESSYRIYCGTQNDGQNMIKYSGIDIINGTITMGY